MMLRAGQGALEAVTGRLPCSATGPLPKYLLNLQPGEGQQAAKWETLNLQACLLPGNLSLIPQTLTVG